MTATPGAFAPPPHSSAPHRPRPAGDAPPSAPLSAPVSAPVWTWMVGTLLLVATGCGQGDPLATNTAGLPQSPQTTSSPAPEPSDEGAPEGEEIADKTDNENRVGRRDASTPLEVLFPTPKPISTPQDDTPIALPKREVVTLALELQSVDGKPLSGALDAARLPSVTSDVAWHAVSQAAGDDTESDDTKDVTSSKGNDDDDTDDGNEDTPPKLDAWAAFFFRHIVVLSPGNAAAREASRWLGAFVSAGESVAFLPRQETLKGPIEKSLVGLRTQLEKSGILETTSSFASGQALEPHLLSTFEEIYAYWRSTAFFVAGAHDIPIRLPGREKGGKGTPPDPVLDAFLTVAPEFLPSGQLVPLLPVAPAADVVDAAPDALQRGDVTLGAFLRDGVLYATLRNETKACVALDVRLPTSLDVGTLEIQRLVPALAALETTSAPRVTVYYPSTDCVPPGGLLLLRASRL